MKKSPPEQELTVLEQSVVSAIGSDSKSTDDLALALDMGVSEIAGLLFTLEVNGIITCEDGKYSRRKF